MSANNWTECPRCRVGYLAEIKVRAEEVANAYGKVPVEEYMRMNEEASNPPPFEETLREDWYIGMSADGKFTAKYSCYCKPCGFEFSFEQERDAMQVQP